MVPDLTDSPIFDEDLAMDLLDQDRDLLNEVLEIFRTNTAQTLKELREKVDEGDVDGVVRAAHSIMGGAANVCAERVRLLAKTLEDDADRGSTDSFEALCSAIEAEFERFRQHVPVAT